MDKVIKIDIVRELSQLYELSLAIGNSLNLRKTCEDFLNVLMRQKNIDFGSVWLKNENLCKETPANYSLIYAQPDFRIAQKEIELNDHWQEQLIQNNALFVNDEMAHFQSFISEKDIFSGCFWLISLADLGFLKLYYSSKNQSQTGISTIEIKKTAKVFQKFGMALRSCLLHNRIIEETEQKISYQEEIKKLAIVAEKTDNAIIITDAYGKVDWVNEGFARISGYNLEEVKGKTPGSVLQGPETNKETIQQISQQLALRNSFRTEILNYTKTGKKYWIEMSIQPIFDKQGDLVNYIAIELDITERKRYERELHQAKEKAEEANRIKQEFLAVVSHEIRTPLNAIVGMTNLVLKSSLNQQQTDYINTVQISAENLQGIINTILDFSTIEAGKMVIHKMPFNLRKTLQNVLSTNEFKAEQKGLGLFLKFDEKADVTLIGDPVRLTQVLQNLVSNAIKFTEFGKINIEVRQVTKMHNALVVAFKITDTGKGIPAEKWSLIFESFTQEDLSISRKYGGTGLGLSISKQLVELMGGDLRVKSDGSTGSEFSFVLGFPISLESIKEKQSQLSENLLMGKKILLVEDNAMNQFFAQKLLEGWGIKVTIAQNGQEGVEKFRAKHYDAILMDIQMPEMDGFQATKIIREKNTLIPIIALTALMVPEEMDHFKQVGMNDYIIKPFVAEDLQEKLILHILQKHQNYSLSIQKNNDDSSRESLYNSQLLSRIMKGDEAKIRQMENLFVKQSEETVRQMNTYFAQRNWKQIGLLAHKIKASIDMLQINTLKQPIRSLALLGKQDKESPEFETLVVLISKTLNKACLEITNRHQEVL